MMHPSARTITCSIGSTDKNSYPLLDAVHNKMTVSEHNVFAEVMNELFDNHYLTIKERESDILYFHDSPFIPAFFQTSIANWNENAEIE